MKKTVLTFGLISGAMSAAMMLATLPFVEKIGWEKGAAATPLGWLYHSETLSQKCGEISALGAN